MEGLGHVNRRLRLFRQGCLRRAVYRAAQIGTESILKIVCEFFPKFCLIDSEGENSKWAGRNDI